MPNEMNDVFLEIQSLSYSYGERCAVRDVSLQIEPGTVFGLLGPNGAGKSTLISCLAGLRRDYEGQFKLLGQTYRPIGFRARSPTNRRGSAGAGAL